MAAPEEFKKLSVWDPANNMTVFIHAFTPDFGKFPLAADAKVYGATLEEGEIFYVPVRVGVVLGRKGKYFTCRWVLV